MDISKDNCIVPFSGPRRHGGVLFRQGMRGVYAELFRVGPNVCAKDVESVPKEGRFADVTTASDAWFYASELCL